MIYTIIPESPSLLELFTSQLGTLATVATAIVAYIIYKKSKSDELENAVRIIILEIKESERIVKNLIETKNAGNVYSDDLVKVIPFKGWSKYSHLFMKKLTNDEYDQLNEYFKKCEVLEKYIEKNHNFFWISTEERARQKEIIGATLALANPDMEASDIRSNMEKISDLYISNSLRYTPAGIATQLSRSLDSIALVTPTPVWNKLKTIAKYDDLLG